MHLPVDLRRNLGGNHINYL